MQFRICREEAAFYAFFSTISGNLEAYWGERFPVPLQKFYRGEREASQMTLAMSELTAIRSELAGFSPDKIIWDIEDMSVVRCFGEDCCFD